MAGNSLHSHRPHRTSSLRSPPDTHRRPPHRRPERLHNFHKAHHTPHRTHDPTVRTSRCRSLSAQCLLWRGALLVRHTPHSRRHDPLHICRRDLRIRRHHIACLHSLADRFLELLPLGSQERSHWRTCKKTEGEATLLGILAFCLASTWWAYLLRVLST